MKLGGEGDVERVGSERDAAMLLRRAEAAERTVVVLKRKVVELYNGGRSAVQKQLEKAREREADNRRRREVIEVRAAELRRYTETLEAEVRRRTEAIKTIVDNVTFGFLVVNRELTVQPECTKSCSRLFDVETVAGKNFLDLVRVTERDRLSLVLAVDQIFEDVLPPEVSTAQMQQKFAMPDGRVLHIDASPIRSASGELGAVLFTVSDITALEAVTRENNANRTLVGVLRQKESFRAFLIEARRQFELAAHAAAEGNQPLVRHLVHTVKGNSASYGLDDIVEVLHAVEEEDQIRPADVERAERALRDFVTSHERVLELDYDAVGQEDYSVTREQMETLRGLISSLDGSRHATELQRWTAHVLRRPASQILGPVEDFTVRLAARLGKDVAFRLTGGDTNVDVERLGPVFQVVSQLIRNALDHGIESPQERGAKPRRGTLELHVGTSGDRYVVRCHDDGRGIDVEALAERAVELGLVARDHVARMNAEERLSLIFVDGLSSARVTTSISGRGVGMSAVRSAVERVSGEVHVSSERGAGTTFTITVPKRDEFGSLLPMGESASAP